MANPFDQFDAPQSTDANPFDQFDDVGPDPYAEVTEYADQPSGIERIGRAVGLATRYGLEGVGGIGQIVSEPARQAANLIPGVDIQRTEPSAVPDRLGLPQTPDDPTSRVVAEASRTLAGGGPFLRGAQLAARGGSAIGSAMAANPLTQAVSAGTSGAGLGMAREAGLGPGGQLTASLAGAALPATAARAVLPRSTNRELQALVKEGVKPTVGQAIGGRVAAAEEKLTSLPVMGDAISVARKKALDQFNKAAINRALKPIGQSIDDIGQEGVKKAGDILGSAYDDAISKIRFVRADAKFLNSITSDDLASGLEPKYAEKFTNLINEKIVSNIKQGVIKGAKFKSIASDLGNESANFSKYQNSAARDYAMVVDELKGVLIRQAAKHANKSAVKALKAADKGYANLVRVELASKAAKNAGGVFTPAQLNMAAQQADKSVRGRAVSRGTALMQDLGGAGQNVLGSKVPTSGTAERLFYGAGAAGAAMVEPHVLTGLLGGAAAYTPPVQNALVRGLMARPEFASPLGEAVGQTIPYIAAQR